nr:hypothetical protein CFP56_01390 [Quercus suber]
MLNQGPGAAGGFITSNAWRRRTEIPGSMPRAPNSPASILDTPGAGGSSMDQRLVASVRGNSMRPFLCKRTMRTKNETGSIVIYYRHSFGLALCLTEDYERSKRSLGVKDREVYQEMRNSERRH